VGYDEMNDMSKKGSPEITVKAVMSLYEGAKKKYQSWISVV